jgi:hypothetical protein
VLSAILAQSFMMVNLPWKVSCPVSCIQWQHADSTYDDTVFADLNIISDGGSLNDRVGTDVDIVSDLHRIVVEISAVRLVWRSEEVNVSVATGRNV